MKPRIAVAAAAPVRKKKRTKEEIRTALPSQKPWTQPSASQRQGHTHACFSARKEAAHRSSTQGRTQEREAQVGQARQGAVQEGKACQPTKSTHTGSTSPPSSPTATNNMIMRLHTTSVIAPRRTPGRGGRASKAGNGGQWGAVAPLLDVIMPLLASLSMARASPSAGGAERSVHSRQRRREHPGDHHHARSEEEEHTR